MTAELVDTLRRALDTAESARRAGWAKAYAAQERLVLSFAALQLIDHLCIGGENAHDTLATIRMVVASVGPIDEPRRRKSAQAKPVAPTVTEEAVLKIAHEDRRITARSVAARLFRTSSPTRAQIQKARRRLESLTRSGQLSQVAAGSPALNTPSVWEL